MTKPNSLLFCLAVIRFRRAGFWAGANWIASVRYDHFKLFNRVNLASPDFGYTERILWQDSGDNLSLSELFGAHPSTLFGVLGLLEGWNWPCEQPTDSGRVDPE